MVLDSGFDLCGRQLPAPLAKAERGPVPAAYQFANYREERLVTTFLDHVRQGRYEAAFGNWESDDRYTMKDFLVDWGKEGYYTKGSQKFSVNDSNTSGSAVVVYVRFDNFR